MTSNNALFAALLLPSLQFAYWPSLPEETTSKGLFDESIVEGIRLGRARLDLLAEQGENVTDLYEVYDEFALARASQDSEIIEAVLEKSQAKLDHITKRVREIEVRRKSFSLDIASAFDLSKAVAVDEAGRKSELPAEAEFTTLTDGRSIFLIRAPLEEGKNALTNLSEKDFEVRQHRQHHAPR